MLEIVNALPQKRASDIDSFLTFIGIYEDKQRTAAFKRLIFAHRGEICGKTVVEAGAGLGIMTEALLAAGAAKVYAVEDNRFCVAALQKKFAKESRVVVVRSRIEDFKPAGNEKIHVLFQELYGSLLLDESILALERIGFEPDIVLPDGGRILGQVVTLRGVGDPTLTPDLLRGLDGALVTDLFPYFKFTEPFVIGEWRFRRQKKRRSYEFSVPRGGEVLVLGMEVWHSGRRISGTQYCDNWSFIATPVSGKKARITFAYAREGMTDIFWRWIA